MDQKDIDREVLEIFNKAQPIKRDDRNGGGLSDFAGGV